MATNMNLPRKPNLGEYSNMPIAGSDYNMSMNKNTSPDFPAMPLSNSVFGATNEPGMANPGLNPFPQNHFNQGINSYGLQSRQFQESLENRLKFPQNSNMAAGPNYAGVYDSNSGENYQFAMARMQAKYRPQDMFTMNKNLEQTNYAQQRNMNSNPWAMEYASRNNSRRAIPVKPSMSQQGHNDPNLGQNMPPDQNFSSPGSSQQAYQMPSPYMAGEMFKQSRVVEQPFAARGMAGNFHPQDFYQLEQMRQMANQYQQAHAAGNYFTANQRNSSSPFGQPVLPKPSQDALYSQQFSGSPKSNGPHHMMNVVDERQMPFPNTNYPVSPVGSQIATKPGYAQALGMRGTVSPNVTIGMPKKPYRPQEEAVTSPGANQNAAAAAAAAAVLAAVNTANPHSSPQSDIHNISSRPPSVPNIPSRPPSIHAKEPGARSPATSVVSDHKSESGGSGINEITTTPSPARSVSRNTPQLSEPSAVVNFPSDVETGRVPSPSVNRLPSSDIEAMIQSVSNIPGGAASSNDQSVTAQRSKADNKPEATSKANQRSVLSPVTPPSPFSLSPSINVDFDIDMLSPSWEDSTSRSATPLNKLYKISEEPERKQFLDKLVSCMEEQDKTLTEVPNFNGSILDLFRLYQLVSKRGGMQEVTRLRLWKEITQGLTNGGAAVNNDGDVEETLREYYIRFLFPYEEKLGCSVPQPSTIPATCVPPSPTPSSNPTASPANPEPGNIDLSAMTYKTLSMFQANSNAPSASYNQGTSNQTTMQPPSYPGTPTSTQGYPSTPPTQHPGYRNLPQAPPGYHGYTQGSPRVPSYHGGHPGPSHSNQQYPGFPGPPSQMSGYHNGMLPSRFPNYPNPRNTVPPEAMFMRDGQFPRGPAVGMNKPFQHMNDHQSQHPMMFQNYQKQGQQSPGYMFQQQASNMAAYQLERQRAALGQRGGIGSPRPRIQSPWGQRYQEPVPGTSSGTSSPFPNSQSPGLKLPNVRPPPPYPHTKAEKPSPTPQSAAAALQYQAMKSGVKFSSPKKEEQLFPVGCVETTQVVHKKKRRLTARDIGPVEAWRIMMSLKSGLLTETAWALDTLTILLSDDATVGFFRLGQLPGFLDTVIEHFRRSLINVFGVLAESEIDIGIPKRFTYGNVQELSEVNTFSDVLPDLIATENFSSLIVGDCLTDQDGSGFSSGVKNWTEGGGDTTIHIQTHLETDPQFYEEVEVENDTNEGKRYKELSKLESDSKTKDLPMNPDHEVTNQGTNASSSDVTDRKEHSSVQVEVNNLFNGIPSPDTSTSVVRYSVITKDSDVKTKAEMLDSGMQQNCCNGEHVTDNCECAPAKLEPGTSITKDPSAILIKRLKTELDLDIESVSNDTEYLISTSQSCDMRTAAPTEPECELKQEFPLSSVTLSQDSATNTCNCVSNIIRNLSFVPGNDVEMAKHPSLLRILAKLLLLHHARRKKRLAIDSQYNDSNCWWQDCLDIVRENTLVTIANIAGYLDLSLLAGNVSRLLLDGLLHWLVCQSSVADEPLRTTSVSVCLTPKQLVLETLAKMSVLETNVDFILNSPDKGRLAKAYEYLVKLFSDKTNEVTREFALVLLSSFTQAKEEICSACSERNLVTVLVGFLEDARDRVEAMAVRGLHPGMFRDNDLRVSMGMLRRAASLMACIAKRTHSTHLIPFQERILDLSMSRALDAEVQSHLSNVLYNLPR